MRAVFFDIDNTLYSYDIGNQAGMEALEDYAVHALKVSPEEFHQAFRQAVTVMKERIGCDCAATHNRLIRIQCILEILKKPLYPHAKMMYHRYWDNLIGVSQPEEGVRELFLALKAKGIGIGIGTDMTAYIQYQKLEKLGLAPYVDWIVTSRSGEALGAVLQALRPEGGRRSQGVYLCGGQPEEGRYRLFQIRLCGSVVSQEPHRGRSGGISGNYFL